MPSAPEHLTGAGTFRIEKRIVADKVLNLSVLNDALGKDW